MLDIVLHLTNLKAHAKAAVGAVVGGAVGAAYQVASNPAAVSKYTAADWHALKLTALVGGGMALVGLIVPSPYSRPPAPQPPTGGGA